MGKNTIKLFISNLKKVNYNKIFKSNWTWVIFIIILVLTFDFIFKTTAQNYFNLFKKIIEDYIVAICLILVILTIFFSLRAKFTKRDSKISDLFSHIATLLQTIFAIIAIGFAVFQNRESTKQFELQVLKQNHKDSLQDSINAVTISTLNSMKVNLDTIAYATSPLNTSFQKLIGTTNELGDLQQKQINAQPILKLITLNAQLKDNLVHVYTLGIFNDSKATSQAKVNFIMLLFPKESFISINDNKFNHQGGTLTDNYGYECSYSLVPGENTKIYTDIVFNPAVFPTNVEYRLYYETPNNKGKVFKSKTLFGESNYFYK